MTELTGTLLATALVVTSVTAVSLLRRRANQTHRPGFTRLALAINFLSFLVLFVSLKIGLLSMSVSMFVIVVAAFLIFVIQSYRSFGDLQKLGTTLGRWRS